MVKTAAVHSRLYLKYGLQSLVASRDMHYAELEDNNALTKKAVKGNSTY